MRWQIIFFNSGPMVKYVFLNMETEGDERFKPS
jgi:hypothetical protein